MFCQILYNIHHIKIIFYDNLKQGNYLHKYLQRIYVTKLITLMGLAMLWSNGFSNDFFV